MSAREQARNYWPESKCARAFWHQHELPSYRELLGHTVAWMEPRPNERWLDLGCGGGQLSKALWQVSSGRVTEIIGIDCAAANADAFKKLRCSLTPRPNEHQLRFVTGNFSHGLCSWSEGSFDGVVSGLAIQYAEAFSEETGSWTCAAYDRVLADVFRLLKPGGRFVFSVNVPEPSWGRVALISLKDTFKARRPLKYLQRAWRMWRYGGWLKREARRNRFHYLPLPVILEKLKAIGYVNIENRLSYAEQAYLFRAWKPRRETQAA
jgi:SAM-dependent methyltransferase